MPRRQTPCQHHSLVTTPSSHAQEAGYRGFTTQQLFTAATGSRKKFTAEYTGYSSFFPRPLVLPHDALSNDPKYPPQSFKSWFGLKERNRLTQTRKTVYVAAPPHVGQNISDVMSDWSAPCANALRTSKQGLVQWPAFDDVLAYLSAFFYGIPVKKLDDQVQWTAWNEIRMHNSGRKTDMTALAAGPDCIGLTSTQTSITTRVRVRYLVEPNDSSGYRQQMNLNDVLDHAIAILPEDAYCLILLVDQDLYEDDKDDFCCGRAYGGSRICVVSSAQYQPALDAWHGLKVEEGHFWPGSHCAKFVNAACGAPSKAASLKKRKAKAVEEKSAYDEKQRRHGRSASDAIMVNPSMVEDDGDIDRSTPLEEAVAAHRASLERRVPSEAGLRSLYLRRLTLTASHELLHCFGLDHCVYHACVMQSTASTMEDSRQPPYLCPVCENKLARAIWDVQTEELQAESSSCGWWEANSIVGWRKARNRAITTFCEARSKDDLGFASLGAWTRAVLSFGSE